MASKICKIVYFDEDSVTDYVQIVAGGTLEKTTDLLNSSDLSEEQKADVSAKGGIGGVFKALLGWEASASGEVSAGLALNRNKMVKNIVKNTILTDFLHIIDENENKSASKTLIKNVHCILCPIFLLPFFFKSSLVKFSLPSFYQNNS